MGLLAVPPVPLGPPASSAVIGVANKRIGDATVQAKGMVFAATNSGQTEVLYRWKNLYDPTTYDTLNQGSIFLISCNAVAVDLPNNLIYWGAVNYVGSASGFNQVTIIQTTIDAFTDGGEIVSQVQLSAATLGDAGANSAMCTDSTSVYFLANDLAQDSWLGKFLISGGTLTTALQMPNPTSGSSKAGSLCAYGNDGFIYVGGSGDGAANAWVGRVDTALGTATLLNVPISVINDDSVLDASYWWVGDEATAAPGNLVRVNRDMSGYTQYTTGIEGWIDCIYQDPFVPSLLWIVQNYSRPGGLTPQSAIIAWDKVNGFLGVTRTSLLFDLNEIYKISNAAFFGITFNAISASLRSKAGVIPIFADPGLVPAPILGRGAAS